MAKRIGLVVAALALGLSTPAQADEPAASDPRPPRGEAELRYWLENMVWYHDFSHDEIAAATGLSAEQVPAALERLGIQPSGRPTRAADVPLVVLPYPGGRHPRLGFLEGAVRPQRETKLSVFAPWDPNSYVVVDLPEAIWSNLGLTYLAHTHIPTVWTEQGVRLEPLEWQVQPDGSFSMERTLPNGIRFATHVRSQRDALRMELELHNGTTETLSDLRVQICVMLKEARGFAEQTSLNKVFAVPYCACRSSDGSHWIITAWEACQRAWGNERCPCLHSDPQFPDCPAGVTRRLRGWLSFYEGTDVEQEFRRIEATGWRQPRGE